MIRRWAGWLFSVWTAAVIGLGAVSVVLCWIGPLVAIGNWRPLEQGRVRLWCIVVLWAGVLGLIGLQRWRSSMRNSAVVDRLLTQPPPSAPRESADMAAVRTRFEAALKMLRKVRFTPPATTSAGRPWTTRIGNMLAQLDGRYLYELPWYLIIGAPGAGKTTALRHSGLQFPLGQQAGQERVRGVGGTRDCDWWFTSQAVLIDTAGRFTTQDSDALRDRDTWNGFLALLRRARPRQPVNGVLVTVSVQDLLTRSAAEREEQAARVKERLQELNDQLGMRFPVYVLVTKVDLLPGFSDYFASLDRDTRAMPWGFTFPLTSQESGGASDIDRLSQELQALSRRLQQGLLPLLQAERDLQRRARTYAFPLHFTALHDLLIAFMRQVFAQTPFEPCAFLRGAYFVSGTQEGTPIDRLLGAVARGWQLERAVLPPLRSSGKSFFLEKLLTEVIFPEAGLAGTQRRWERRRVAWLVAGYAVVALASLGALTAWTVSWFNNRGYVGDVQARVTQVRRLVQTTPNRATPDLVPLLPALAATRALAQVNRTGPEVPWSLGFGLFQGRKLDAASRRAYERMLVDAVLPRVALRVEEQLRARADAPELQYESLKTYLMLHDPQHWDGQTLGALIRHDWEVNLPRSVDTGEREQLRQHLAALLGVGAAVSPLPFDQSLVTAARASLGALPLPQRVYNRLKQRGAGSQAPEFNAASAGGAASPLVFERRSGQPITQGVPGFFTRAGWDGLAHAIEPSAKELLDEQSWVLGNALPGAAGSRLDSLVSDVKRLYLTDYANTWEAFIADLRLRQAKGLPDLVQLTRVLAGPDNPLGTLLRAISRETTLAGAAEPSGTKDVINEKVDRLAQVVKRGFAEVAGDRAAGGAMHEEPPLETLVDDRFALLRRYVQGPPGGKAPLDDSIALLNEAQLHMAAVELAVKSGTPPPQSDLPVRLAAEGARSAEPVRGLLADLGRSSAGFTGLLQRELLSREVRTSVGDFCNQAIAGRYPLSARSANDATFADFGQLFGPGGRFDRLFQEKLASVVDTGARVWKFRNEALGQDVGSLPQFQRAQVIRETFFAGGGTTPSMRLEFKPVEMDARITQFVLDVDGQVIRYVHGPQIPTAVQWPGPRGTNQVRLQLTPAGPNGNGVAFDGPWALHRLFDGVKVEPGRTPERFRVTFDVDGRKAIFEVTAASVRNPLRLRELAEFNCPNGL